MINDQEYWDSLRQGDKTALAYIYRQHVDALYSYGAQLTRDHGIVEDAIQDLFIELWQKRDSLGPTTNIRPYLIVSIRRKIIRLLGSRSNQELNLASHKTEQEEPAHDQSTETARLKAALQQLSEQQREVLYLKYFEGYDYKEIAEYTGFNHQSIRNTASRAINSLRKILGLMFLSYLINLLSTLDIHKVLLH